jgi:HK97 family phage portal protein
MGFFRDLIGITPKPEIKAQLAPSVMGDTFNYYQPFQPLSFDRAEAITIPSVQQARNIICGIISGMELSTYSKATGEEIPNLPWVNQLTKNAPNNVTLSWIVDSLIWYSVAYLQVKEVYQDDNRPARFEYVVNSRVTVELNNTNTLVKTYHVDGKPVPMEGIDSLVTIQIGKDSLLTSGARILRSAADLEKAVAVASSTPQPAGILKNNGADMGEKEVAGLLAAWRRARESRSTAYLTASLEYQATSFSPKDMMYVDALQNMAAQIARLFNIDAFYLNADQNASMVYQNILDNRRQLVSFTLAPYIQAIERRFSLDDLTPSTQHIRFDIDSGFLRTDPLERLAVVEKMLELQLITVEQARAMEDLSPNGDN